MLIDIITIPDIHSQYLFFDPWHSYYEQIRIVFTEYVN
jgi:hypothetical protein